MQGLFDTACVDQDYCVTVFAQLLKKYPSTGCLDIFVDAADPVTTKAILVGMKTELTRLLASKTDLCCVPFEYLTFKRPVSKILNIIVVQILKNNIDRMN